MSTVPTKAAAAFIAANAKSPVVEGEVKTIALPGKGGMIEHIGDGGRYRLKNGKWYDLSLEDCRSMPMPRWDLG